MWCREHSLHNTVSVRLLLLLLLLRRCFQKHQHHTHDALNSCKQQAQ